MTISRFVNDPANESTGWATYGTPRRSAYREWKRLAAAARREGFDADVARIQREQNVDVSVARRVAASSRRASRVVAAIVSGRRHVCVACPCHAVPAHCADNCPTRTAPGLAPRVTR